MGKKSIIGETEFLGFANRNFRTVLRDSFNGSGNEIELNIDYTTMTIRFPFLEQNLTIAVIDGQVVTNVYSDSESSDDF